MLNLNRAQILGNLTRDPELRFTPNGQAVSSFSVATNRRWKGTDGNLSEAVEYHEVVVWGKYAESVSPMMHKGQPVFVEGRLQTRNWEGQDGIKRYKTEIVADNIIVLSSRSGSGGDDQYVPETANPVDTISKSTKKDDESVAPAAADTTEEIDIEEIPF